MVTERHTIKISTEYTTEARKEFNEPSIKSANKVIVYSLIAAAVFVLLIIVSAYFDNYNGLFAMLGLLVFVLFIFLFGVLLRHTIKKGLRAPLPHTVFDYEIYDGGIAAKETVDGEVVNVSKYYNKDINKTVESSHYLFLYTSPSMALVIDKSVLYPAELSTIKANYFHQNGEHILQLAAFKPGIPDFTPYPQEQNEIH